MSVGESSPLPLLEYNRRCRILVVAPQRHPVTQGFGARTLFLIWAADIEVGYFFVEPVFDVCVL